MIDFLINTAIFYGLVVLFLGYTPETTATRKVCFDTFNINAGYVADERGYQSIYKAIKDKFPEGVDV